MSQQTVVDAMPTLVFVPVTTLSADNPLQVDLYFPPRGNSAPVLFRERSLPVGADDVERLRSQGVRQLGIPTSDYIDYQRHLRENLHGFLANEERPIEERVQFLGELARDSLKAAHETGKPEHVIAAATQIGERLVKLAVEPTLVAYDLYSLLRHDYCNFAHAYNVAAFAIMLAGPCGIVDESDLRRLGVAALLHDIGKLHIPSAILGRAGPLSDAERALVRRHPETGFERLSQRSDIDWEQLMVVYQHHEQPDGHGYPVGSLDDEIHPWAKLCSVVNRFDSRTSLRPYRPALPVHIALEDLGARSGTVLDAEMVRRWRTLWKR